MAKSDAHNLLERFQKHEAAILLFAKLAHVPFTNNRAERDLRMGKVKQKISGCFRVEKYAHAYCRISSLGPVRAKLIKKGMIYSPTHGDMAFTVPVFDDFMRRAMSDFLLNNQ